MTVLEVIQRSAEFLERKGVDSARLQSEWLAAHALGMPRLELYLNFDRILAEPELERLRGLVRRRAQREPLQHILGTLSFCGLDLAVDRNVLIPRPETERLAELAWTFLGSLSSTAPGAAPRLVLDLGTGSGCLAIAIAVHAPDVRVHALDLSRAALTVARQNAGRHGLAERIAFVAGDGLAPLAPQAQYSLIVSNPPYIPTALIESLEPEVRDHDPRAALDGGSDGLNFYRRFAAQALPLLRPGGQAMLELGDGQGAPVRELFEAEGWMVERIENDDAGRPRYVVAGKRTAG